MTRVTSSATARAGCVPGAIWTVAPRMLTSVGTRRFRADGGVGANGVGRGAILRGDRGLQRERGRGVARRGRQRRQHGRDGWLWRTDRRAADRPRRGGRSSREGANGRACLLGPGPAVAA